MILGVVVGRAGSKGLPNKNILDLGGKPLVQWVMEAGLGAKKIDKLIVSSDSPKILEIAEKVGVEVPFARPEYLSADKSLVVDALKHALEHYDKEGLSFDYVVLLQPTSPFTDPADIDKAIELALDKQADTIISGKPGGQVHPSIMFERGEDASVDWITKDSGRMSNRQSLTPVWHRAGNVYIFHTSLVRQRKIYGDKVYSIEIPKERAIGIDDAFDLNFARFMLSQGKIEL